MELYSAIPEYAAYLGCTYDDVICVYVILAMLTFVIIGVCIGAFMDVGDILYRLGKKGVSALWRKVKKNSAPGKEHCS